MEETVKNDSDWPAAIDKPLPSRAERFYLRKVSLNAGGYDRSGNYWGAGTVLWYYESHDCSRTGHLRAIDRKQAKKLMKGRFGKDITFFI